MLVSIIVPVYQAEKYLHKCIESLIKQTYSKLEILLIDDGSTDKSLEVCKQYQEKDIRIKVLSQKNQGVSATRNKGIREATGEYILFVDSDDYIDSQMVEYMIEKVKKDNCEIVFCGFEYVYNQNCIIHLPEIEEKRYSTKEILNLFWKLYDKGIFHNIGTKLYSRKLLNINNIFFDEKKSILEDVEFCLEAVSVANNLYVCNKNFYRYMMDVNPDSIQKRYRKDFYIYLQQLFHRIERMGIEKDKKFYLVYMDAILLTLRNELFRNEKNVKLILGEYRKVCCMDYVDEAKTHISVKDVRILKYIFYLCIWKKQELMLYVLVYLWYLGELR